MLTIPDFHRKPVENEPLQASCAEAGTSTIRFHAVRYVQPGGFWATYCGTGSDGVTMMSHDTKPAADVAPEHRCKKAGCVKAWRMFK